MLIFFIQILIKDNKIYLNFLNKPKLNLNSILHFKKNTNFQWTWFENIPII